MSHLNVFHVMRDMTYGGVDFSLPGNGGDDCTSFLSLKRRALETLGYVLLNLVVFSVAKQNCKLAPDLLQFQQKEHYGKKILLVLLCLVFGIELGYKLSTRQIIYLLNPCHILNITQIILLCLPENSKLTMMIFRCHIHMLFGAFLAILFPVVNSRLLPFEVMNYWNQHLLIFFIVPPYLLSIGGSFTIEAFTDFSWSAMMSAMFCFYMFLFLQPLGLIFQVNLNNMVCPAISDPFYGKNYRLWAMVHQQILTLTFGKIYSILAKMVLSTFQRKTKSI